jgi:hypothetical protein
MKRILPVLLLAFLLVSIGVSQQSWPDLTTIDVGNKSCSIDGAAQPNTEKAKLNDLKNRFRLPAQPFKLITFAQLQALDQGHIQGTKIVGYPASSNPNNQRAVSLEGYVRRVSVGGCSSGESCNCGAQEGAICDTHINVLPSETTIDKDGHNTYIVEITQRTRILASKGLLSSNIGNDWSTDKLKPLEGHRVRFSGYLYFDTDHVGEAWVSDPDDTVGPKKNGKPNNWRETCWEVHPVMKIEVLN